MSKILCELKLGEVPLHLYQIIAGFLLLKKQGVIDLKIEKLSKNYNSKFPYNMMEAKINGITIVYDVNDGYDNLLDENQDYKGWMDQLLENCDLYFKRSYSSIQNSKLKQGEKIFPLGLNYMVTIPGNPAHSLMPNDPEREKLKKIIRKLPFSEYYNGLYYINSFEDVPRVESKPKILFMARLWDIKGDFEGQIGKSKQEERAYINEFRAKCIKLCKKEFGDSFFGGITPSKFAIEKYPDLLIKEQSITKRNNYLQKVKESSICVATMGLHQSIGWKFAEYVAASKAIVTERMYYEVPGDFRKEENFLVFNTPEECIEQINRLIKDSKLRYKMMLNNYKYYHEYVRADRLVHNSIFVTLQKDLF